jgi:hypothetical protein
LVRGLLAEVFGAAVTNKACNLRVLGSCADRDKTC